MSKKTNKFAPGVRERAVRMVVDYKHDYPSGWAAVMLIAEKIGCVPQRLREWVKMAAVDSGKRAGVPTEAADKVKPVELETCCQDTGSKVERRNRRDADPLETAERFCAHFEQA